MAIDTTALQVTPEGQRALVDAQLREMDSRQLGITFRMAADRYEQDTTAGLTPNLVEVFTAAVTDTAPL